MIRFSKAKINPNNLNLPPHILNHEFLKELGTKEFSRMSFACWERVDHSHT